MDSDGRMGGPDEGTRHRLPVAGESQLRDRKCAVFRFWIWALREHDAHSANPPVALRISGDRRGPGVGPGGSCNHVLRADRGPIDPATDCARPRITHDQHHHCRCCDVVLQHLHFGHGLQSLCAGESLSRAWIRVLLRASQRPCVFATQT